MQGDTLHIKGLMKNQKNWAENLTPRDIKALHSLYYKHIAETRSWIEGGHEVSKEIIPRRLFEPLTLYQFLRQKRLVPKCSWAENLTKGAK